MFARRILLNMMLYMWKVIHGNVNENILLPLVTTSEKVDSLSSCPSISGYPQG